MCSIDMPSSCFWTHTVVCAELTWPLQTHVLSRSPLEVLSGTRTSCWDEEMRMAAQTCMEERKADRAARTQPYLNTTRIERKIWMASLRANLVCAIFLLLVYERIDPCRLFNFKWNIKMAKIDLFILEITCTILLTDTSLVESTMKSDWPASVMVQGECDGDSWAGEGSLCEALLYLWAGTGALWPSGTSRI